MKKLKKQYLRRIIWIVAAALVLMAVLSNFTNYLYSSKILKNYINEDYRRSTKQIKQNFMAESDTLENLAEYIYISEIVLSRANFKNEDFRVYGKIRDIYSVVQSINPYLNSVQYYDSDKKTLFGVGTVLPEGEIQLNEILEEAHRIVPKKLMVRDMTFYENNDLKKKKVFSYFMFGENTLSDNSDFFIINIDFDWLYNSIFEDNIGSVAVFDEDKQILFSKGESVGVDVYETAINNYKEKDFENKIIGGEEYVLCFEDFGGIGIVMCRIASLTKAYPEMRAYILTIIIFIIMFAFIGIIIALYVIKVVYKPIDGIFKEVATVQVGEINEIEYIQEVLKRYRIENKKYSDRLSSEEEIVKGYSFREIMRNSDKLSEKTIERYFSYLDIPIDSNFAVIILRINRIDDDVGQKDGMISYALYNISTEIIGEVYDMESQFFMGDDIELLLNVTSKDYVEKMRSCFGRISECMLTHFNTVISMSVSDVSNGIDGISQARAQALNNLKFTFNFGGGKFFEFNDNPEGHLEDGEGISTLRYEEELKRCITEESTLEVVDNIFKRIMDFSYERSILEIICFTKVLGERLELNPEIMVNLVNPNVELTIMDVLGMVKEDIRLKFAAEEGDYKGGSNSSDLIRTTIDFVENNFSDANLCITIVAENVGISTRKLSRMFLEEMGMRFSEYLIDFRIQKAKEFMLNSDLNIKDISKSIGIENDTYFYKRFKEKCGMTPTEFRKNNRRKV
ncbi:MAG: AraC family transcriptional regulator [Clostridiales bacterium]|nr:AraC family transcriptional regulator [Clostridiales bacterium]